MKKPLLVVLALGAAWWYFVGGRKLDETKVRDFYQAQEVATFKREPETLCGLLAKDFHGKYTYSTNIPGHPREDEQNKAEGCEGYRQMYANFAELGDKMGGMLTMEYNYTLYSIKIAPDHKSATVDVGYLMNAGGALINIRARATETLIRRNGKVLLQRSEGSSSIKVLSNSD
ncbi:MAG: hypothetical protein ACRCTU_16130 [Zoogloea sp.]|uniref:hypothetical protein n=1 Tax=Zoogloea sp. TaxID=49181 RepID=UPI003F2BA092